MKKLRPASQIVTGYRPTLRRIGLMAIVLALGLCFCGPAAAQSIKFQDLKIQPTDKGFKVTGKIEASNLNPEGQICEYDSAEICADIQLGPTSQYQKLPESMYLRPPEGSETTYTKGSGPGGTMTKVEAEGVGLVRLRLADLPLRGNPVWQSYGGLGEWAKNAPASVTADFEGLIPLEHAGKTLRIRATLKHEWGGPNAPWPAFSFRHDVGFEGVLKATGATPEEVHKILITKPPSGRPNPVELNQTPDKLEIPVFSSIEAKDTRGHQVRYLWTCELGQFDDPAKQTPIWTQPREFQPQMKDGYGVKITCQVTCTKDPAVSATASYTQKVSCALQITGTFYEAYYESNPASKSEYVGDYVHRPWGGLLVMVTGPDGYRREIRTRGDGTFRVDVPRPGVYTVEVEDCDIFSKEYVYQVKVPPGRLGEETLQNDKKMWDWARLASGYRMMKASGLLHNAGSRPEDVNGLGNVVQIKREMDWSADFHEYSRELLGKWAGKKWKYVQCPGKPTGGGLLSAILRDIENSVDVTAAPNHPPTIERAPGGGLRIRGEGTFLYRPLRPNETVDAGWGRHVVNSTVLFHRDAQGLVVYVLEGLVLNYQEDSDEPAAAAITSYKMIHDAGSQPPRVERFEWAEAEKVWRTGQVGTGSQSLAPIADTFCYAYTWQNWNRLNWGAYPLVTAGWHPTGGAKHAYLRFELPRVPSVKKATLRLYHCGTYGSPSLQIGAYRVESAWQEGRGLQKPPTVAGPGELSWEQQPKVASTPVATAQPGDYRRWVEFDVTSLVNEWLSGRRPNYGVCIRVTNENERPAVQSEYHLSSREAKDSSQHPQLVLEM